MALFTITTKRRKICNGVQIEPGMTVQVVSPFNNPVTVNGGQAVEDAFMRVFGISLKKANALNMSADSLLLDVVNKSAEQEATLLGHMVSQETPEQQRKILKVVEVLLEKE